MQHDTCLIAPQLARRQCALGGYCYYYDNSNINNSDNSSNNSSNHRPPAPGGGARPTGAASKAKPPHGDFIGSRRFSPVFGNVEKDDDMDLSPFDIQYLNNK